MLRLLSFLLLAATANGAAPPQRMLWAWYSTTLEAPVPSGYGIAFSIMSLYLRRDEEPKQFLRRTALPLPVGTYRMGVVRIEFEMASFSDNQRHAVVRRVAEAVRLTRVDGLQVDFDAPKSAWPFYQTVIREIRNTVSPKVFLSITALTSWCGAKSWMEGVTADELVPMLFETGLPVTESSFGFVRCNSSAGVSLVEPVHLDRNKRVYIFPGKGNWTAANIKQAVRSYPLVPSP